MASRSKGGAIEYWVSWQGLLLAAAVVSGAIAWWLIAWPVATLSNIEEHGNHFALTFLHMVGGTGMLFLGGANLYLATRRIGYRLHRRIGQAYLAIGTVGSLTALAVTMTTAHKPAGSPILTNMSVSLAMLSLAWLACALLGWRAARNRRFDSHRDWMIRAYVLVWSFVFCRLGSRVPALGDMGNGEAFSWLSWVGPLLLCEVALQWSDGSRKTPRLPGSTVPAE
jgi:hypothetical protein